MPLESGTRLGPYEVLAPMGSKGAERYKASDTRSDRLVTITVLPQTFAGRPEVKKRLEREAEALSSLAGTDISGLVEIGHEAPSTDFVVAEYVEGETLAERLARGPMELPEALETAVAIVASLDSAHRRGVIHGGLTPASVMLTDDGPKLVDFGIAKLLEDSSSDTYNEGSTETPSPSMAITRTSVSSLSGEPPAGVRYMAPERLTGTAVDARTDIFAFGTVLYEMLAGRPAFEEKTGALLVAAVQSVDPEPVSAIQPMVPAALDHVVARCLAKDPRKRLQTARDLARQLRWIAAGGSQVGVPVPVAARRQKRERILWVALAAGLVLAVGLVPFALSWFGGDPSPEAVRFTVAELPIPSGVPISISPDGRWVVASPGGTTSVIGVLLDSVTPQTLAPDNIVTQPFWAPNSQSIAFFEADLLKSIDVAGGPARTIAAAPAPIGSGTWGSDGIILFASGGVIHRVPAAGGEPTEVTSLDDTLGESSHLGPYFLPDGRHYLYTAISQESAVYLGELDSTERTRLFAADSKALYAEPGYILFNRADTLFAQPFDADALALTGEPILITDGVAPLIGSNITAPLDRSANIAVSQTGVLVFKTGGDTAAVAPGGDEQRTLEWRDRSGTFEAVGPAGAYAGIDLAPDGTQFAVHLHESGGGDSWTFDVDRGRLQQLTFDASQHNASPIWSPEGDRIAFGSQRNNQWGLYIKRADGTGAEERVLESGTQVMPMSWSPDGSLLVYSQGTDVWAVGLEGDAEPFPILNEPYNEIFPTVSPDGEWIAYQSDETGQAEIYVKQFPEGPAKYRVSTEGGNLPRWRGDGRELYYVQAPNMMAVEIEVGGDSLQPGVPRPLFTLGGNPSMGNAGSAVGDARIGFHPLYHRFAVTADGERFLLSRPGNAATAAGGGGGIDTALIDTVDQGGTTLGGTAGVSTVILNWPQLLEER